jgi:hypothetical protein
LPLDWDRLEKLLNMTASQHDAEVLTAIRMSNNLLKQERVKWADVLAKPKQIEPKATAEVKPEYNCNPRHTVRASVDVAVMEMRARIRSYPAIWRWLLFQSGERLRPTRAYPRLRKRWETFCPQPSLP